MGWSFVDRSLSRYKPRFLTESEKEMVAWQIERGLVLFVLYTQPLLQILFNHFCPHQFFTDDTQLCKSCSPEHYGDTRNALQTYISDIKDRVTENKLQLNADKTETIMFDSSKLKHPSEPLSICKATISFSDSVKNLGLYLDKELSMKEHINFICKTAFLETRRISTIRHYLTEDATKSLVSHVLSRIDFATLSKLVSLSLWSANFRESKTVQLVL